MVPRTIAICEPADLPSYGSTKSLFTRTKATPGRLWRYITSCRIPTPLRVR